MIGTLLIFLTTSSALAQQIADFANMAPVKKQFSESKPHLNDLGEPCLVKTMPATISQDGLGFCYAASAAVMLDEYSCYVKSPPNQNCTGLSPDQRYSQIDLARFTKRLGDNDKTYRGNYEGLVEGGSVYEVLLSVYHSNSVIPESCSPMDQIMIGVEDDLGVQAQLWTSFQNAFFDKDGKSKCTQCRAGLTDSKVEEIKDKYQIRQDKDRLKAALAQETLEKALDELLILPDCKDFTEKTEHISPSNKMDSPKFFPPKDFKGKPDTQAYLKAIKDVTCGKKRPIGYSFCAGVMKKQKDGTKTCPKGMGHAVVIEGYEERCEPAKNGKKAKCVPALKIRNSWGEGWQKANNDGWVDAQTLLGAAADNHMTWIENIQ